MIIAAPHSNARRRVAMFAVGLLVVAHGGCGAGAARAPASSAGASPRAAEARPAPGDDVQRADRDGDRIVDACDVCPDAPETYQGMADEDGCPDRPPDFVASSPSRQNAPAPAGCVQH